MHHYLVVANRTLGGRELHEAVSDRLARGPATVTLLVPATPSPQLINDFNALSCAFPVDPSIAAAAVEDAQGEAQQRLDTELQRLRALGATVEGVLGDSDPLRAIEAVLAERAVDEIILSTLPSGISRWLSLDLPNRLRRRTDLPLTVITTTDSE